MPLTPIHRASPRYPLQRTALALAIPVAIGLASAGDAHGAGPSMGAEADLACFVMGAVASLATVIAVVVTERRRRVTTGWLFGTAALAGTAGTAALEWTCPMPGLAHRAIGHGAIGLGLGLAMWAVYRATQRGRLLRT